MISEKTRFFEDITAAQDLANNFLQHGRLNINAASCMHAHNAKRKTCPNGELRADIHSKVHLILRQKKVLF